MPNRRGEAAGNGIRRDAAPEEKASVPRLTAVLATMLALLSGACTQPVLVPRSVQGSDGRAVLYLQPLPEDASRLRFSIEEVAAVAEDGREIALPLRSAGPNGSEPAAVQKLLASGGLPEGAYQGLVIEVGKASLAGEAGEAPLLLPDRRVPVDHPFRVQRRRATPLFLALRPTGFLTGEVQFTPSFSLSGSSRVLAELAGLASNPEGDHVTVFDKKTFQVKDLVATGGRPTAIALDVQEGRAYVAGIEENTVEILDVFSGEIVGRIPLNLRDEPRDLALAPDGRLLLSANYGTGTASIIDPVTQIETDRIKVGEGPTGVVIDPRGLRAYVTNSLSDTVSVIDLAGRELVAQVTAEGVPVQAAFSRAGDRLYVVRKFSAEVLILDPVSLRRIGTAFAGTGLVSVEVDTRTDLIFLGNGIGGEIVVLDPFSLSLVDRVRVGGPPVSMAIDGEEGMLLVADWDASRIRKIRLVGRKVVSEIELEGGIWDLAVMGAR